MASALTKGQEIQGSSLQKKSDLKGIHCLVQLALAAFQRKLSKEKTDNTAKGKLQLGRIYLFINVFNYILKHLFIIIRPNHFSICAVEK